MIKQEEIEDYLELEANVTDGEKKLKLAKAKLSDWKESLLVRVLNKEPQQKGKHRLETEEYEKRASISWKSVVIDLKGLLFVEKMIAEAPRDVADRLVIRTSND